MRTFFQRRFTSAIFNGKRFRRVFAFFFFGISVACYALLLTIGALKANLDSAKSPAITTTDDHNTKQWNQPNTNIVKIDRDRLQSIAHDFHRRPPKIDDIINPHPFDWVILEKDICHQRVNTRSSSNPLLLIIVHSDPAKIDFRSAIRDTWASTPGRNRSGGFLDSAGVVETKVIFAMGSVSNRTLMKAVKLESEKYRDIIQEDFQDSYKNLTYKAVMWMKWSWLYCPRAFQILKVDDDVFVNRFALSRLVREFYDRRIGTNRSITCHVWVGMPVVRDSRSKWYVSPQEYEGDTFTPYCSGGAYMLSGDLPGLFYQKSMYTKFFWVDDVYATGMLREQFGGGEQGGDEVGYLDFPKHTYLIGENELNKVENYTERVIFVHTFSRRERIYYWWNNFTKEALVGLSSRNKKDTTTTTTITTKMPRIIHLPD